MLLDKKLNSQLIEEGYIVIKDCITSDILSELKDFYLSTFDQSNLQKFIDKNIKHVNTAMSDNLDYKYSVYRFLVKKLTPLVNKYFNNFNISVGNFIVKYPGGDNECKVHQDISLVRESEKKSSFTLWFSLCDLDEKTAPLYVVPGTHITLSNFIRGIDFTLKLDNFKTELLKRSKLLLPFKAGDIVVMNPRVVHGSLPTPSDHNLRIAIGLGITPKTEKLFIYQNTENGLEELEMSPELLLQYNPSTKKTIKCNRNMVKKDQYDHYKKFFKKLEKKIF